MNNSLPASAPGGGLASTAPPQQQPSPSKKASKKSQKAAQNQNAPTPAPAAASAKQSKSKAAKASNNAASAAVEKPTTASGNDTTTPTPTPTAKAKKETDAAAKKHAAKPQSFKITREKERKEKQQKQAAALAPPAAVDAHAEPDAVKSRNHRLFLAPPTLARSSRDPCWTVRRASASLGGGANVDSVADRLHDEILEYAHYTRVTVEAMAVHIEQMIAHVGRCVHALWPKSTMEPFGSYSTGIWLPSSDVDLVILGVVEIHDRSLTVKSLRQLARALEKQPWVESLVVLDTAKIPVLKLVTAQSSVPIDITFESSATHSGLLARDLIKRYADEMPELYPLAVVFKQLLRERDLNDAYTGGLSSYSIVLMIIHFQLLWRYGERCFRAAALFASGSPLPRPADLLAEEERQKKREEALLAQQKALEAQQAQSAWGPKAPPTITSSFASVVARPKSLKRPASEAGKSGASDDGTTKPVAPAQPFSYAAVAAGIVKLSTEEPGKAATTAPSSYAAAVAAPAQPAKAKAKTTTKKGDALDAVSVTSSTADTEDCSDGSSSTTTSAHEDADHASSSSAAAQQDAAAAQQQPQEEPVEMSLGERTMTILEFYGILFDYRKNGLSIRDGGYIYRLAEHVGSIPGDLSKKLVIEDPIHPDRNVSASSFAFSKVVAVFEDSFYALKYFRPSRFTPSALSCLLSTSGHSLHQYQQQFHHLLAGKSATAKTSASTAKPTSAVPQPHKGVAIAAK